MDRASYFVVAALLDLTLGVTPFLQLGLEDTLAVIALVLGLYSFLPIRELTFTAPVSLVPSLLLGGSPIPLVVASVLSTVAYYFGERSTSFLLVFSLSLLTMNSNTLTYVLGYLLLTASLIYLKLDLRGIVTNGILFLLLAGVIYSLSPSSQLVNQFSDAAYYSLFFGVFGIAVERGTLPRRFPRVPLLFVPFSLLALTLGLPEAYYWWTPKSFFFRADPLSLWIPMTYFPQVNEVVGAWPLSHLTSRFGYFGVDLYMALLVYVSGISSFLLFRSLRVRHPSLMALVYQLLSPFDHPYFLFGYSLLPLTVWLMNANVRGYLKYPAVMITSALGSSYFLFPLQASLLGGTIDRRTLWAILAMIGANLFWIIPYAIAGFPEVGSLSDTFFLALLLPLMVASLHFDGERRFALLSLGSLAYIVSGLPYGEALYPVALISALLAVSKGRSLITGLTVFLLVSASVYQFVSFHPVEIPPSLIKVQTQVENATLVWWNSSYPLLSSVPINETPFPINAIQYVVTNGTVHVNKDYTGFPVNITVILPSNLVRVNGSWISETRPYLVTNSNNFTFSYKSSNLTVNQSGEYVILNSKLALQFLDWKFSPGNSSAFAVSLSGHWVRFFPQVYLALAENISGNVSVTPISFSSLLVTLGNPSPILEYTPSGITLLGYATPLNLSGNFNLTLYFLNSNGYVELYGEEYDGRLYQFTHPSHFPWGNVTDVMLLLPLGNEVEISDFSISTLLPLNLTREWVAWSSPTPTNVTFVSSSTLNGTLHFSSSVPIKLLGVLVNGSSSLMRPGENVVGLREVVIESPPGPVNLTSLVLGNTKTEYYVVGRFNVSTNYTVNRTLIAGGLLEKIETPIDLNVTVVPLPVYSNPTEMYYLDGKILQNKSVILTPGNHTIVIYFTYQKVVYPSIYLTIVSFPLVILVSLLSRGLKDLMTRLELALERMSGEAGSTDEGGGRDGEGAPS